MIRANCILKIRFYHIQIVVFTQNFQVIVYIMFHRYTADLIDTQKRVSIILYLTCM